MDNFSRDAILKYLCGRYDVAENWYPVDLQLRARVDEVCTWSNMNVHASSYGVYSQQVNSVSHWILLCRDGAGPTIRAWTGFAICFKTDEKFVCEGSSDC